MTSLSFRIFGNVPPLKVGSRAYDLRPPRCAGSRRLPRRSMNGFLRGSKKAHIDAFLSLVLVGLLITVFVVIGLPAGLLAIALTFLYAALARPLAARSASALLSVGPGESRVSATSPEQTARSDCRGPGSRADFEGSAWRDHGPVESPRRREGRPVRLL